MFSRRKRSLFLIASGHLVIELCSSFLPVLYPVLISTLALTYTQVGVIALVASVGNSLAQPLFGYLSDRWNPRRMSALSVIWIGLLMGLVGLMNNYTLLVLLVGLGELGSAAFHPPAATIAAACGGKERGAAVSVFSVGGSVGSALGPLLIAAGLDRLGMPGTVVLIPIALLSGVLLYFQLRQAAGTQEEPSAERTQPAQGRNLAGLALIVVAVMCLAWFQVSFKTYLSVWVRQQGQTLAMGGQMLFVLLAASGLGSLIGGRLSDRIGHWQLFALCLALLGPAEWLFINASVPVQVTFVGAMGILIGATFPVSIVMAQEAMPDGLGIASGLVMGLGWLPGGIGASLTGRIADQFSLETGMRLLVLPIAVGVGSILIYARLRRVRLTRA